jgi:hypothetical protein
MGILSVELNFRRPIYPEVYRLTKLFSEHRVESFAPFRKIRAASHRPSHRRRRLLEGADREITAHRLVKERPYVAASCHYPRVPEYGSGKLRSAAH